MYTNYPYHNPNMYNDRFIGGFAVPFLLGGLGGAALVGLSRPRPVYYTPAPYPTPSPIPYGYQQYNSYYGY